MPKRVLPQARLRSENEELRSRVEELEQTIAAIRAGEVDALVINRPQGNQIFTLQGAEHPYRVLVETMNEGAATLDESGVVLYSNAPLAEMLGVPLERFIGTPLEMHVGAAEQKKIQTLIADGLSGGGKTEINVFSAAGHRRLVRFSIVPMQGLEPLTTCLIATEVTELMDVNEALRTNEESLRQLSTRLLQLQDEERRRIARDLHDVTGQKLAFQSILLSQLVDKKGGTDDAAKNQIALKECLDVTQQVSEEIRTLSYLLHPPLLDELGLTSAVPWYTRGFETRTGIRVDVKVSKDLPRLPPDVEVTLFRIIQESLTNVHRYSGSATASIRLDSDGDQVKLEIGDAGRGINKGTLKSPAVPVFGLGVGIQGMRERMRQLSGTLEIRSLPNQGTLVIATLPIREKVENRSESASETAEQAAPRCEPRRESSLPDDHSKKRILIADDHEVLRRGVRLMLEAETDWEICGEATDGSQAVEMASSLKPDLVILDINMPVLNGLAAVHQMARKRPELKILVFTMHDSDQTVREILAAGAHGYLSKAKAGEELIQVVRSIFSNADDHPARAAAVI